MNNSIDCHYSIIGKGPALFLIHGIGAAEDAWRFIVPKLSKHFTVITYDLRGHGKSPVTHKNFNLNNPNPNDKVTFNRNRTGFKRLKCLKASRSKVPRLVMS